MLINAKSESWRKFLLTIDAQNVWKKVYTYGVKKEFMKTIEITGIKLPTGETTTSLDETINAVLQKSFPSDSEEKDNIFQKDYRHAVQRNAINTVQFSDKSTEDFPVICYTDGSKIDGRVGFAFVVFRSGVESENFQFRIRDECTVFVAELLCLNFAVKWITEQNSVISEYLICTDSLSSLDSLKCISSSNNIIVEIQKQLKSLRDKNISIDFAFVRGHTGVLGNERADWLAKAATKRKIDIDVNIPKSFYKKIMNERMMKSWNQEYLISNKGSITKKFFPTINKRLSCHHFYTNYKLTQFLTGHGNFKSYLNKFNLAPSSFCDCNIGGEENVEHVILLCSKANARRKAFPPFVTSSKLCLCLFFKTVLTLLTTTPHQRKDVSALNRFSVHRCPTRRIINVTGLELVTKPAMIRYHSATAATNRTTQKLAEGTKKSGMNRGIRFDYLYFDITIS
ncbi:uncharacterized protein TNCV_5021661 [Trichonephila clavipes]|nr:uncharacterized protein TNCV_5021661 [Trichonephila clavipes]